MVEQIIGAYTVAEGTRFLILVLPALKRWVILPMHHEITEHETHIEARKKTYIVIYSRSDHCRETSQERGIDHHLRPWHGMRACRAISNQEPNQSNDWRRPSRNINVGNQPVHQQLFYPGCVVRGCPFFDLMPQVRPSVGLTWAAVSHCRLRRVPSLRDSVLFPT